MLNRRRRRALACAGAAFALCAPGASASPLNSGGPVDLLTESNLRIEGLAAAAKVGDKIASAGDFNGDGINDVALGVWMVNGDTPTRAQGGAVYVVFGKASPTNVNLASLGANGVRIEGALAGDHLGWALTPAGDVNGDGKGDLLIGTPWADPSARTSAGGARVVYGRSTTTEIDLATDTAGFRIDGAAAGDRAGFSVASADVNGDGRRDFILGAIGAKPGGMTDAGAAYVVFSKADQGTTDLNALGADGFRIGGESAAARTGWAVAGADLDSDGKAEVVASAIGARNAAGTTYVVKGRGAGADVDLAALGTPGPPRRRRRRGPVRLVGGHRRRQRRRQGRPARRRPLPRPGRLADGGLRVRPDGRRAELEHRAGQPRRGRLPDRRRQDPGRRRLVDRRQPRPQR